MAKSIDSKLVLVLRKQPNDKLIQRLRPSGPISLFDKIIVPSEGVVDDFPRELIPQEIINKFSFTGPIVRRFSKSKKNDYVKKYTLYQNKITVTACAGAGGFPGTIKYFSTVVKAFEAIAALYPSFQGLIFTGSSFKESLHTSCPQIKIFPFEDKLPNIFAASTIVVTQAGYNTINEIILAAVPAIIVPGRRESDDQYARADALNKRECARMIKELTVEALTSELSLLLQNKPLRHQLQANLYKIGLKPGNRKAATTIKDILPSTCQSPDDGASIICLPEDEWPANVPPDRVGGVWQTVLHTLKVANKPETMPQLKITANCAKNFREIIAALLWCNCQNLCLVVSDETNSAILEQVEIHLRWLSSQKLPIKLFFRKGNEPIYPKLTVGENSKNELKVEMKSANWRIVRQCNANCHFCNHWRDKQLKGQEYQTAKAIHIYDQLKDLGIKKVVLNGGEPLLHPQFLFIVRHGKSLDMNITANTNATLLSNDKFAKDVIDSGLDGALISLHSSNSQLHDYIKGKQGIWNKTIKGIRALRKYSSVIDIRINVVLMNSNFTTALEIAKLGAELNVNSIQFSQVDDLREVSNEHLRLDKGMQEKFYYDIYPEVIQYCTERNITTKVSPFPVALLGDGNEELGFDTKYNKQVIDLLRKRLPVVEEELRLYAKGEYGAQFYSEHSCYVPTSTTYIMANGDIYPCVRSIGFENSNDVIGNIYDNNLKEILTSEKYMQFVSGSGKHDACLTCKNLHRNNLHREPKRNLSSNP